VKPEIPRIQITPLEAERLQILFLDSLKALHIQNRKHLQTLEKDSKINRITRLPCICAIVIIKIIFKTFFYQKEKKF